MIDICSDLAAICYDKIHKNTKQKLNIAGRFVIVTVCILLNHHYFQFATQ